MSESGVPGTSLVEAEEQQPNTGTRRMVLNMGPQHPSTHGVLRLLIELDGENIVKCQPDIGFLHTGIEKECEVKTYQQVVTLTDRVDYLAPLSNNLCYCLAVEKLLQLEIPPQAQWMRVMLTELTRLNSHLVWLGTHAIDIGAMSVFLYCFREREEILKIFEMFSGQRMMTSYFRIGGLALEPPRGWQKRVKAFIDMFPSKVDEYESLLTNNRIWLGRTKGIGYISLEDMLDLGITGPMLRAAGLPLDTRKTVLQLREVRFRGAHAHRERRVRALPGAHRGDAAEHAHHPAGDGRDARGAVEGGCAARGAARPGKDEDADGSAHLPLQDRDRGLPRAGGRGLPGDRIPARRAWVLRGERWNHAALPRAHAHTQLRKPAGRA
jgi:hypothetical protein